VRVPRRALTQAGLVVHVLASVGWIGAALACGVVAVLGTSAPTSALPGLDDAFRAITLWVVLPLGALSVVTGLLQGLLTRWGLARYYWVVVKEVVTAAVVLVLLLQLPRIADGSPATEDRTSFVVHSLGGAAVLLLPLVLSVVKPRGLTRRGRRPSPGNDAA
jgi:hypothetical protein